MAGFGVSEPREAQEEAERRAGRGRKSEVEITFGVGAAIKLIILLTLVIVANKYVIGPFGLGGYFTYLLVAFVVLKYGLLPLIVNARVILLASAWGFYALLIPLVAFAVFILYAKFGLQFRWYWILLTGLAAIVIFRFILSLTGRLGQASVYAAIFAIYVNLPVFLILLMVVEVLKTFGIGGGLVNLILFVTVIIFFLMFVRDTWKFKKMIQLFRAIPKEELYKVMGGFGGEQEESEGGEEAGGRGGGRGGTRSAVKEAAAGAFTEQLFKFVFSGKGILIIILILGFFFIKGKFEAFQPESGVLGTTVGATKGALERVSPYFNDLKNRIFGKEGTLTRFISKNYAFTNPAVNEKEVKKGIKLLVPFKPRNPFYTTEQQPILQTTKLHIDQITAGAKVIFSCGVEDPKITAEEIKVGGRNVISVGYPISKTEDVSLICVLPKTPVDKDTPYRVSLAATYSNFVTKSKLRYYSLQEDVSKGIKDPFKGIDYPQLNKAAGVTSPECVSGCGLATLSISIGGKQPLSDKIEGQEATYPIGFRILGASGVEGRITKLTSLKFIKPIGMTISGDSCAFDGSGTLTLKKEYLDDANVKLENAKKNNEEVDLEYWCDFTVTPKNTVEEMKTQFDEIQAEANYDYNFDLGKTDLEIRKLTK